MAKEGDKCPECEGGTLKKGSVMLERCGDSSMIVDCLICDWCDHRTDEDDRVHGNVYNLPAHSQARL